MVMPRLFTLVIASTLLLSWSAHADHARDHVNVKVPPLSDLVLKGQRAFNATCAECHGVNGQGGTQKGPPLIHPIYNPGHHSNQAIYNAVLNGVRQHHWPYGNMPPQKVSFSELVNIVNFLRETQQHNGIKTEAHQM